MSLPLEGGLLAPTPDGISSSSDDGGLRLSCGLVLLCGMSSLSVSSRCASMEKFY